MSSQANYHLMNTSRENSGIYSCAIDCFVELCYYSIYPFLQNLAPHLIYFFQLIFRACQRYELHQSASTHNLRIIHELISREVRQPL